jgi:hypothetical protein
VIRQEKREKGDIQLRRNHCHQTTLALSHAKRSSRRASRFVISPAVSHMARTGPDGRMALPLQTHPNHPALPLSRLATSMPILHTLRVRTGLARAPSAGPNGAHCAPSWWRAAWLALEEGCRVAVLLTGRKAPVWGRVRARVREEGETMLGTQGTPRHDVLCHPKEA